MTPLVSIGALDTLWFQVGGTLCNLSCSHCFISCNPGNDSFGFLSLESVRERLRESIALGVKEYYFTGGEPFLNKAMVSILRETLALGPASVLSNGTVFRERLVEELAEIAAGSRYSLELRISLDGFTREMNDPIRGPGTFDAALRGVDLLVQRGFLPVITVVQTWPDAQTLAVLEGFQRTLRARGYDRPRIKMIPTLRIGMEATRSGGYSAEERITAEMLEGYDQGQLLCSHGRIVTDRGIAVCPILIESPEAILGQSLAESLRPFPVVHPVCLTCYLHGAICSNTGASLPGGDR